MGIRNRLEDQPSEGNFIGCVDDAVQLTLLPISDPDLGQRRSWHGHLKYILLTYMFERGITNDRIIGSSGAFLISQIAPTQHERRRQPQVVICMHGNNKISHCDNVCIWNV